ncbi:MAG: Holliday junction branch migration protein RuvA [Spirochaetes bacterium]|nr:Holliday junction branch migration protein RuvA [Spirochaetota bacterium]
MYNSIQGVLTGKSATKVFLENQGIEYELEVSFNTLNSLPELGSKVRLFTYLHHREDVLKLYGFFEEGERRLFLDLLKVDGVGPRQALRILSGTTVQTFLKILETEDVKALTQIPGLGMKTAQKVLLSLKGKINLEEGIVPREEKDLQIALVEMGFEPTKATEALRRALKECRDEGLSGEPLEREAFRRAIVLMSGTYG